jgi:hypothetical protein
MSTITRTILEFENNLTHRLARQLIADAKVMSTSAVVRRHGIDWHQIDLGVGTTEVVVVMG